MAGPVFDAFGVSLAGAPLGFFILFLPLFLAGCFFATALGWISPISGSPSLGLVVLLDWLEAALVFPLVPQSGWLRRHVLRGGGWPSSCRGPVRVGVSLDLLHYLQ